MSIVEVSNIKSINDLEAKKSLRRIILLRFAVALINMAYRKYLKKHPELLDKKSDDGVVLQVEGNKPLNRRLRRLFIRGGFLNVTLNVISIASLLLIINDIEKLHTSLSYLKKLISPRFKRWLKKLLLLVRYKLWPLAVSDDTIALKKLLNGDIEIFKGNGIDMDRVTFDFFDNEEDFRKTCQNDYAYLFESVMNPTFPMELKNRTIGLVLLNYLKVATFIDGRKFIICLAYIIERLYSISDKMSIHNIYMFLIYLIKNKKVRKELIRILIQRLMNRGIPIDIELLHLFDEPDVCVAE